MGKIFGFILLFTGVLFQSDVAARQFGNYISTAELEQKLENTTGQERIKLLLRISSRYDRSDTYKARELAEEALSLSAAFDNDSLAGESNLQLGYISLLEEKSAAALSYYSKAKEIFNDFGIKLREATTLVRTGQLYSELGHYPEALEHYYEALTIFQENGGANGEIDVLLRISLVMNDREEYEAALNFAEQTIDLAEQSENKLGLTMALSQAADIERQQNHTEGAIAYYERAMSELKEMGSIHGAVSIMLDLSGLYEGNQAYSDALDLNAEVFEFAKSNQNSVLLIESMFNFSRILHVQGDYEASNDTLFSALDLIDESGLRIMQPMFQLLVSENYLESGNPEESVFYSKQARKSAKEQGDLSLEEDALQLVILALTEQNEFAEAFQAQRDLMVIRDSIFTIQNAEQIARMQARYEISEKEKEIELLESENEQKAMIQLFLGIGFLLVLITGFFLVRSQRLKIKSSKSELELSRLKRDELQKDLEYKNKQLTTQSLNMVQKNEMMEEIKQKIDTLKEGGSTKELNSITQLVDYSATLDEDWKQFKMHFEEVHSGFYHILKDRYPNLTPNEMRLSALVKLNLTIKEMAAILGISPDSVKTARYRLRKKLNLKTEDNLAEFMLQLEKESLAVG